MRRTASLYGGALRANVVGGFTRLGRNLTLIHPGYDAQGRRRLRWTQVVYKDVPIWEWKHAAEPAFVVERFDAELSARVKRDSGLFERALEAAVGARRRSFRDGVSGVEPAPAVTIDGRKAGTHYPS